MKINLLLLTIVGIIFLAGCTGQNDTQKDVILSEAKKVSTVNSFLFYNPDADVNISLVNEDEIMQNVDYISDFICGGYQLPINSYWKVKLVAPVEGTEYAESVELYLDQDTLNPVCIYPRRVEVVDMYCVNGKEATIVLTNIGSSSYLIERINVQKASVEGTFTPTWSKEVLEPWSNITFIDKGCVTTCNYRITPPEGRSIVTSFIDCTS